MSANGSAPPSQQQQQQPPKTVRPDFKLVESSRKDFDQTKGVELTKTKDPEWKFGGGANDGGASLQYKHVQVDPHEEGRPAQFNYKLLLGAIVPRPIGFMSTRSKDGSSTNLAPFSYTQMVTHEPPIFVVGIAGGYSKNKDTLRNLTETGECCINMVSEHIVEAMNATSIDAPYGVSEWALSGLTPVPCTQVQCARVQESVFAIEGKVMEIKEFESRVKPGTKSAAMAIIEGVRFWVREDATNEARNEVDPAVLRAVGRMGGITYTRTVDGFEMPRPVYDEHKDKAEVEGLIQPRV